jgi:O-methyltransferase involved in polyketide biosynthesis
VVFDFSVPAASLSPLARAAVDALAERVAAAGEPFRSCFEPEALVAALRAMGFRDVRDVAPDELNARYFAGRADGLRVGGAGHVLVALG